MSTFTFDVPVFTPEERIRSEFEAIRADTRDEMQRWPNERARIRAQPLTSVCVRLPTDLLIQLDRIAQQADSSRSTLLRHIAYEFVSHVQEKGIRFRGCLGLFDTYDSRHARAGEAYLDRDLRHTVRER